MNAYAKSFHLLHGRRTPAELPQVRERIERYYAQYGSGHVTRGRAPGPGALRLNHNDYLGLGGDPRILAAQKAALEADGADTFMSGVYVQHLDGQRQVERQFAAHLGSEDAAICQSGFAANEGLIQALADAQTPVYLDHFAHASLWQGAQAAGAPAVALRHNDLDHLRQQARRHGPGIVCVDSLFSVSGDTCPLEELIDVCEDEGLTLVVDESHAVATIGDDGEGLVAALGLVDRVPFRTFSLSKGFVGRGGIVAASARFIEYFRYESRPAIFSSVVMPSDIARFGKTLEVVTEARRRRYRLHALAARLRQGLTELGYDVRPSRSQIVPLVAGPEERTAVLREALESRGVFGAVFCAPATPKNRSCVRLTVHTGLSEADIDRVIEVCDGIRGIVRPEEWPSLAGTARRRPAPAGAHATPFAAVA